MALNAGALRESFDVGGIAVIAEALEKEQGDIVVGLLQPALSTEMEIHQTFNKGRYNALEEVIQLIHDLAK